MATSTTGHLSIQVQLGRDDPRQDLQLLTFVGRHGIVSFAHVVDVGGCDHAGSLFGAEPSDNRFIAGERGFRRRVGRAWGGPAQSGARTTTGIGWEISFW